MTEEQLQKGNEISKRINSLKFSKSLANQNLKWGNFPEMDKASYDLIVEHTRAYYNREIKKLEEEFEQL